MSEMKGRGNGEQLVRLGRVLRRWRLMEEKTLRAVSAEMLVSASTLMRVENGEGCDAYTLAKIMTWLLATEPRA